MVSEGDYGKQATGTFSQAFVRPNVQKLKSGELKSKLNCDASPCSHPRVPGAAGGGKMTGTGDTKPEGSSAGRRERCSKELFAIRRETEEVHSPGVPGGSVPGLALLKIFF